MRNRIHKRVLSYTGEKGDAKPTTISPRSVDFGMK